MHMPLTPRPAECVEKAGCGESKDGGDLTRPRATVGVSDLSGDPGATPC